MADRWLLLTRFVKEYEPTRIAEEARKAGVEIDVVKYGQVKVMVEDGRAVVDIGGRKLADYGVVIPRSASKKGSSMVGIKTAVLSQVQGQRVLNKESFRKYPLLGKLEQGLMLAVAGLPTVEFFNSGSKKGWQEYFKMPKWKYPVVVKGRFGSHGRTVKLVNSEEELRRLAGEYKAGEWMIQPKLIARQWYRAIVAGGKYLGEMRHRQKDKYGGEEGKLVKLNDRKMERLREISLAAAELFNCDYAGMDIMYDEEKEDLVILEVNRTAQFKYFERRTGVNVAAEIINLMNK